MLDEVDMIVERRRLRRKLTMWRIFAVVGICAAIGVGLARFAAPRGPYIARYDLTGIIIDDAQRDDLLAEIAEDDNAKALILRINSPGGTTVGGEAVFESLRKLAERKPVVAMMGEVAASGGYIAALGADHIVARGNTITGSIGVIAQMPNISELMNKIGIEMTEVKSAPLKAAPSPFQPVDPAAIAAEREMVLDSFDWFVDLVRDRRGMTRARARALADGRVYTGRQALANGLIDAIGGEAAALDWLSQARGVDAGLSIRDEGIDSFPSAWEEFTGETRALLGMVRARAGAIGPHLMSILP